MRRRSKEDRQIKVVFSGQEMNFKTSFSKKDDTIPSRIKSGKADVEEDRQIKAVFSGQEMSFKTSFSKKDDTIPSRIKSGKADVEEVVYDEIVFYDGGGVEGYGYD